MLKALKKSFGVSEEERKLEPDEYIVQANSWPEMTQKRILEAVSSLAQKGVSSIEITLNHPESLTEYGVSEIKTFHEEEDVQINIHASLDLRAAMAEKKNYDRVEDYMEGFIEKADEIDADYINLHTSNFPSPELGRSRGVRYEVMVTPWGENVDSFVEELVHDHFDSETLDWLVRDLRKKLRGVIDRWRIQDTIMQEDNDYFDQMIGEEEIQEALDNLRKLKESDRRQNPDVTREEAKRQIKQQYGPGGQKSIIRDFRKMDEGFQTEVAKEAFRDMVEEDDIDLEKIFNEFRMYQLIGWWMYERNDSIWRKICDGMTPDDLDEKGNMDRLVDAVAGKYLEGHIEKWEEDLEEADVTITLETPDAREKEYLGYYRLVDPTRIYHVIKSIDHPNVQLCFDFEHIATHGYKVKELLDEAPGDLGEETYLVHLSSRPSPGHEHFPLAKGEKRLYEMLWKLKQRGFESGYISFERGGGQGGGQGQGDDVWQESISIAKDMAMYMEDDISPEELPIDFFGYDEERFKRDQAVIQSNTFEPIKGLIESPQMQDTFLGKHATEAEPRMRGEGWEGEEHQ